MKKNIILSLLAMFMLAGCGTDNTIEETSNETSYESDDRDEEESDSNSDSVTVDLHHQGVSCLDCHGLSGSIENDEIFLSGGTVYTTLDGNTSAQYASGYKFKILLDIGTALNYYYDYEGGTANSYNNNSALSSSYTFTAQVINISGTVVNTSITNSHNTSTHLDCNKCHSVSGSNGAPGRVTSYDYYTANPVDTTTPSSSIISFSTDVMSTLTAKCAGCHANSAVPSGSFTMADTASTYTNITDSFVDTNNVDASLLLTKANGINHNNVKILETTSAEYIILKDWITQGALNN